jgi:hypothetical protein
LEDDERNDQADDRIGERESDRDDGGAREDAKADKAVDTTVLPFRDERRTLRPATARNLTMPIAATAPALLG